MKKFLILFVMADFLFVGLVLHLTNSKSSRQVASVDETHLDELTEGQKNKWLLVETLQFSKDQDSLILETDKLQMICDSSTLIELKFYAQNVAIAGVLPNITHTFSCEMIKNLQSQTQLVTRLSDFRKIHKEKTIDHGSSRLVGSQIYSDEEFPTDWRLSEIKVSGQNNFTINEYEIEKILKTQFNFSVP